MWSPARRVAFRATFAYFTMFGLASLLDSGPAPRRVLAAISEPVIGAIGHGVMRLQTPPDSGAAWTLAQQLAAFLAAGLVAAIWSVFSRRTEYERMRAWSRNILRYYVAIVMMTYAGFKIIESQFPPIPLDQLAQPLGSLAPMGLLWAYMGSSPLYASFTGLGEWLGAFLLFFRRTTTAGALILVAVLSNVALINYLYDVPVKQLSTNLLLAAIVLAAADMHRIIAVFLLNAPTQPVDTGPLTQSRLRRYAKAVVVVGASCGPIVVSYVVHGNLLRRPPLYGIYAVEQFARNGATVTPDAGDPMRWGTVIFSRPGAMSIRLPMDSLQGFVATVDPARHTIEAHSRSGAIALMAAYEPASDGGLRLRGRFAGDSIDVTLRRLDERKVFRLLQ